MLFMRSTYGIKASVGLALITLLHSVSATSSFNATKPRYNCVPGHACWPSDLEWEAFNRTLSGNLRRTVPYAASCYYSSQFFDAATCDIVVKNYTTNQPRTDVYGAATSLLWESWMSQSCSLDALTGQQLYDQCYTGRLSSLYVDARQPKDIATAIKFAKKHHLRVSVKNTGHDYFGRSLSPGSLAIWTHNMDSMSYHAQFKAFNCSASDGQHIGQIGAGAQAASVYPYFQGYGMDVTGGNEGSVGLAGGFGQAGGHGVFGPSYGLMVDNAVEFDVVTADGEFRTINQCNDPDLFWAMRGGGGGSFGVLTSYRFQLYPAVKINVYTVKANVTSCKGQSTNYPVLEQVLRQHATWQPLWSHHNVSGHAYYTSSQVEIYLVLPSNNETALKSLTQDFSSYIEKIPDLVIIESSYATYSKYTEFLEITNGIAAVETPGGIFEAVAGRLIPETLFQSNETIGDLVDAVMTAVQRGNKVIPDGGALLQIIMTTPVNRQNGNTTSVNPAWRTALWHLLNTGGWPQKLPSSEEDKLLKGWLDTIDPLKALTPGGGCYLNEGHFMEPNWQETFFGSHYKQLLEIKQRYDPTHFFDCWKCVGWEGPIDNNNSDL